MSEAVIRLLFVVVTALHLIGTAVASEDIYSMYRIYMNSSSRISRRHPMWNALEQQYDVDWVQYVPSNSWNILMPSSAVYYVDQLPHVIRVRPLNSTDKIHDTALPGFHQTTCSSTRILPLELHVSLVPSKHCLSVNALLRGWGIDASDAMESNRQLTIRFHTEQLLRDAVRVMSASHSVVSVERALDYTPQLKWTKPLLLDGVDDESSITSFYNDPAHASFWDATDQTIGVVDTGVDTATSVGECHLRGTTATLDPDSSFAKEFNTNNVPSTDAVQLKGSSGNIVNYLKPEGGTIEDEFGHGTYVTSILTGKVGNRSAVIGNPSEFEGIAQHALLSIVDILEGRNGELRIPADITPYFDHSYNVGARVQSHAWGGFSGWLFDTEHTQGIPAGPFGGTTKVPASTYNAITAQFDAYVYNHPEFLPIVAAGSYDCPSSLEKRSAEHIAFPAHARNALAVGASFPSPSALAFARSKDESDFIFDGVNETAVDLVSSSSFSLAPGTLIGNTADGRSKPDLFAPGFYIMGQNTNSKQTSCSSNNDSVGPFKNIWAPMDPNGSQGFGSSAATAVVTGLAALVRKHLMEKHQPLIRQPSAALIKSLLLHGAIYPDEPVFQYDHSSCLLCSCRSRSGPKMIQRERHELGFGYARLHTILDGPLHKSNGFVITGYNASQEPTLGDPSLSTTGEEHVYPFCYRGRAPSTLKLTLVWTDYANGSLSSALHNDIDLIVEMNDMTWYGNGGSSPDTTNNVEQLEIALHGTQEIDLVVRVLASYLPEDIHPQAYSLIRSGTIQPGSCSEPRDLDPSEDPAPAPTFPPPPELGSVAGVDVSDIIIYGPIALIGLLILCCGYTCVFWCRAKCKPKDIQETADHDIESHLRTIGIDVEA